MNLVHKCKMLSYKARAAALRLQMRWTAWQSMTRYKASRAMFYWGVDRDGDLVLRVAGILNITKYKDAALISWGRKTVVGPAAKYVEAAPESSL